jgi:hypothetical protein
LKDNSDEVSPFSRPCLIGNASGKYLPTRTYYRFNVNDEDDDDDDDNNNNNNTSQQMLSKLTWLTLQRNFALAPKRTS